MNVFDKVIAPTSMKVANPVSGKVVFSILADSASRSSGSRKSVASYFYNNTDVANKQNSIVSNMKELNVVQTTAN